MYYVGQCKMQTFLKFAVLFYVPSHFNLFLPSHQLKRPCQNRARNSKKISKYIIRVSDTIDFKTYL